MPQPISHKVWFITGASKGFGYVWAEAALARGDRVAAAARNIGSLDALKAKLERLDAIFRQSIHARGNRTNGERVSRRDFGFYFSSAKGI